MIWYLSTRAAVRLVSPEAMADLRSMLIVDSLHYTLPILYHVPMLTTPLPPPSPPENPLPLAPPVHYARSYTTLFCCRLAHHPPCHPYYCHQSTTHNTSHHHLPQPSLPASLLSQPESCQCPSCYKYFSARCWVDVFGHTCRLDGGTIVWWGYEHRHR